MKRKIMQECPVYKNKDDIIDSWLFGKTNENSYIGTVEFLMEEINISVAYGENSIQDDDVKTTVCRFTVDVLLSQILNCFFV